MLRPNLLSRLVNRLADRGGRRLPESVLNLDYCLAWFLVGLSTSPLRDVLAFKGGTCLKRCYFVDYRFSEDLDFTQVADRPWADVKGDFEEIFATVYERSHIQFGLANPEDVREHGDGYTFHLSYVGPLPKPATVKVDIRTREVVTTPLEERLVLPYPEYEDLPTDASVMAYSLDEIVVEKTIALHDRVRKQPRDLYDIWYLVTNGHVALEDLVGEIQEKLEFRGKTLAEVRDDFAPKEKAMAALWKKVLANQMVELPEFGDVFRAVKRLFRQAGISG